MRVGSIWLDKVKGGFVRVIDVDEKVLVERRDGRMELVVKSAFDEKVESRMELVKRKSYGKS